MGQREQGVSVTQYEGSCTKAGDRGKGSRLLRRFVHYTVFSASQAEPGVPGYVGAI